MSPDLPEGIFKAFEKAASVARKRTRGDRGRAPTRDARRVLQGIEEDMFNPDFSVATPRPSATTFAWFAKQRDTTPARYLTVRRIEVALYLLDHSDVDVATVARLVGYRYPQSFTKAFKKMMGYSPTEERRQWISGLIDDPTFDPAHGEQRILTGAGRLRQAMAPFERAAMVGAISRQGAARYVGVVRFLCTSPACDALIQGGFLNKMLLEGETLQEAHPWPDSTQSTTIDEEFKILADSDRVTLEILRRFDEGAADPLRPILAELHAHLFEPEYSLEQLKYDLLVDSSELTRFSRMLRISAWQYLLEARLETAARLLRDSPLTVTVIAEHVGYADPAQFRRAFKKWTMGLVPAEYRAWARHTAEQFGPPKPEWFHWRFLDQLKKTDGGDGRALMEYLEKIYRLTPHQPESTAFQQGLFVRIGDHTEQIPIPTLASEVTSGVKVP